MLPSSCTLCYSTFIFFRVFFAARFARFFDWIYSNRFTFASCATRAAVCYYSFCAARCNLSNRYRSCYYAMRTIAFVFPPAPAMVDCNRGKCRIVAIFLMYNSCSAYKRLTRSFCSASDNGGGLCLTFVASECDYDVDCYIDSIVVICTDSESKNIMYRNFDKHNKRKTNKKQLKKWDHINIKHKNRTCL